MDSLLQTVHSQPGCSTKEKTDEPSVSSDSNKRVSITELIQSPTSTAPVIHNIPPRLFHGSLMQSNNNSLDWSWNGLLAFGCQNRVIIVEPRGAGRVCQSLHKHQVPVSKVKWVNENNALKLASGDIHGNIIIWDVGEASVLALIPGTKETKNILTLEWICWNNIIATASLPKKQVAPQYLLALYSSHNLILYDSEFGDIIWKKHFSEDVPVSFSIDAFCKNNILFAHNSSNNQCYFSTFNCLNEKSAPVGDRIKYYIGLTESGGSPKSPTKLSYALHVVYHPEEKFLKGIPNSNFIIEYNSISYHNSIANQVFVVFSREILLIDLSLECILCSVAIERNCTNILRVHSCWQRTVLVTIHESGNVAYRLLQKHINKNEDTEFSVSQLNYLTIGQSDSLRLMKQIKIFGGCVSPLDETKVAILLSTGKILIYSIKHFKNGYNDEKLSTTHLCDLIGQDEYKSDNLLKSYRLLMSQIIPSISLPPHVIRMCPPVTMRNWPFHMPLLAIGDISGSIQIWNLASALLQKEFSIHSSPVRGIEWASLTVFLSFAYPNISNVCGRITNELNITDIVSGQTIPLRTERNVDSSPIEMLKVSHLKQYFILALKEDPFEIWDLKSLQLLRVMPKQFTTVTAIEWSPLYNKRIDADDKASNDLHTSLLTKENFVVTNTNGELYHFSIEGNVAKEISCIPPDNSMNGNITCIAWKSDQVVIGDADGNINVWDLKKKSSKSEPSHRSWIKKIRFGPGRGNMKFLILYNDGVDIWDVKEFKTTAQLKSPRDISYKIQDIDWAGSDRPVFATSDGSIVVTDLKLKTFTSSLNDLMSEVYGNSNDVVNLQFVNMHYNLISQMSQFIFRTKLLHNNSQGLTLTSDIPESYLQVARLFGDKENIVFWSLASSIFSNNFQLDTFYELFLENKQFLNLQIEKTTLLETKKNNHFHIKKCCDLYLLLGLHQKAVQLLLETDPQCDDYYIDSLKACLITSLRTSGECTENTNVTHPIVKLVSTNLIANGKIYEGAQLLSLIGKAQDACRYLQSGGKWEDAVWLAKVALLFLC